jgi:S-adenosylmethionine-diacylgycerolhomoserine-N-methlytransferase
MGLFKDLKILYHLVVKPIRGSDHAARMENFYSGQADGYDDFRRRLLQGREKLWNALDIPEGGVWVDMGGGTGSNLEFFGPRIEQLKKVHVVDLSASLLDVARQRAEDRGWSNVEAVEADATQYAPSSGPVDVVTFSYSLTMIPDWFAALENALAMLKPGGLIGVVDFYVSRKWPAPDQTRHSWFTRSYWPVHFATDNVFPSPDHVPFLHRRLEPLHFSENFGKVPYVPLIRMPYYTFVGRKRPDNGAQSGEDQSDSS